MCVRERERQLSVANVAHFDALMQCVFHGGFEQNQD